MRQTYGMGAGSMCIPRWLSCGNADHVHVLSQNAGQRPAYPGVMKNAENSGTSPRIIVSGFPTEQAGGRENGGKVPTADRCQLRSAPAEQQIGVQQHP